MTLGSYRCHASPPILGHTCTLCVPVMGHFFPALSTGHASCSVLNTEQAPQQTQWWVMMSIQWGLVRLNREKEESLPKFHGGAGSGQNCTTCLGYLMRVCAGSHWSLGHGKKSLANTCVDRLAFVFLKYRQFISLLD